MRTARRQILSAIGAGAAALAWPAARAQAWPDKPITLVIGYTTGGSTDATARLVGRALEKSLGKPVVFEYKPGAGASIGAEFVARAAPDGYTIGLTDTGPMTIMPNLRKLKYDPVKDFTQLSYVCSTGIALIVHPDVRRSLMTIRAFNEGARALSLWVGTHIDMHEKHPDPTVRKDADDFVALMTPIVKAYFTDMGFECTNMALQIYGGHGYIREYGMEQFVRDARIAQIYEGANGIQALDLVGRKLPAEGGRLLRFFFHPLSERLERTRQDPQLKEFAEPLSKSFARLQQATQFIVMKAMSNPDEAGAASSDYLRMFGLVALGDMWLRMAEVSMARMPTANGDRAFHDAKIKTARFFFTKMLPEVHGLFARIMAGAAPVMALEAEGF